ncbi:XRE family transcriptional regulator [Rummeliibacillus sp. TYF005]|uniref:helix-turn-helix domain-containing protein n=1 Tax=Rummeliibacillus sp. TYF005 TaxID=2058214 RepID=UPI000F529CCB|nr:helix-turn-helix transcriptional regulator [Rummeliibacillus sp. TYF005]RPJ97306.1 XRE family transcriptional regulator [Rummeliibacillus sp. TYF005]
MKVISTNVYKIDVKLYKLLNDNKMTYQDLADKTGLSTRTISTLVNNKMKQIPVTALEKIAEAFSLDDIRDLIDFKKE